MCCKCCYLSQLFIIVIKIIIIIIIIIKISPTRLNKKLKGRHFSSDAEVIAAAETWLDGQLSELFLSGLQKLEFGR